MSQSFEVKYGRRKNTIQFVGHKRFCQLYLAKRRYACHSMRVPLSWNQKGWITESKFSITYADYKWKDGLTKIGTILELRVYKDLKDAGKEVLQSVHIDWDGVLESEQKKSLVPEQQKGENVLNEIDVLTLEGIIPTFISCKCGNMDQGKALTPMYELETVATRFGGKYSKKRLATLKEVTGAYAERAEEMGIELWCCE